MNQFNQCRDARPFMGGLFTEWEMRLVNLDKKLKYNTSVENKDINLKSALILLKLLILKKKFQDVYDCLFYITLVESKLHKEPDDLLRKIFEGDSHHFCEFLRENLPREADKEIRRQITHRLVDDIPQTKSNETRYIERNKYKAKIIEPAFYFLGSSRIMPDSFNDLQKFMLTTKSGNQYGAEITSFEFKTGSTDKSAKSDDTKRR
ncbi:MAG: hypothetical protein ABIG84_08570 [archaeon]